MNDERDERRANTATNDTIVAAATGAGMGGIGIIRISGPDAERILTAVFRPPEFDGRTPRSSGFESHRFYYGRMMDGEDQLDECMAVMMRSPRSYTREDVAEIHLHGGPYLIREGIRVCTDHGARLAEAGEFTRRAFLNGRIDLSRAEAVMSLIAAESRKEQQAAVKQLTGGSATFVRDISEELIRLQSGIAACIDYPEEVSEEEGAGELRPGLEGLIRKLKDATDERSSRLIYGGLTVTLYGRPNVGKSSILNALLGEEKAIVTDIPGTTRDIIQGEMMLDGIKIRLTDTAGIRPTEDPVEKIGVERSRKAMREADMKLLVLDGSESLTEEDRALLESMGPDDAVMINKSDLRNIVTEKMIRSRYDVPVCLTVSAVERESLQALKELIREKVQVSDGLAVTQPRHLNAIRRAVNHMEDALETMNAMTLDMVSVDLQAAQNALCEITGEKADEMLLDQVFSQFCVGK